MSDKAQLPASLLSRIVTEVSTETGVSADVILGLSRDRRAVIARHSAMHRLRSILNAKGEPKYGLPAIGRAFRRHHTTVLSGLNRFENHWISYIHPQAPESCGRLCITPQTLESLG